MTQSYINFERVEAISQLLMNLNIWLMHAGLNYCHHDGQLISNQPSRHNWK